MGPQQGSHERRRRGANSLFRRAGRHQPPGCSGGAITINDNTDGGLRTRRTAWCPRPGRNDLDVKSHHRPEPHLPGRHRPVARLAGRGRTRSSCRTPAAGRSRELRPDARRRGRFGASGLDRGSPARAATSRPTTAPATPFPAPAPAPQRGREPLDLHGGDPNGTWELYVVDDAGSRCRLDGEPVRSRSSPEGPPPHSAVGSTEVTIGNNFFNPSTVNVPLGGIVLAEHRRGCTNRHVRHQCLRLRAAAAGGLASVPLRLGQHLPVSLRLPSADDGRPR